MLGAAWETYCFCRSFIREDAPEPTLRETVCSLSGLRAPASCAALLTVRPPLSSQGSEAASKGDFLFSSDHLIEMATKLYRTTLSQTRQKLNIEISDEYVHAFPAHPCVLPAAWFWGRDLSSLVYAAPTIECPVCVCRWFQMTGGQGATRRLPSCT